MRLKKSLVWALEWTCSLIDELAYRPVVVKLTMFLPRWWHCDLARLAVRLDERWDTGRWGDDQVGAPTALCDVCKRRAAYLVILGRDWMEDVPPDGSYWEEHPVNLCGVCGLDPDDFPIDNDEQLAESIARARERSISWRWSWPVQ